MADKANVTNVESLERFRSSLVIFVEKISVVLDEVSEEVKRTRVWLQSEQRMKLDHVMKRKQKELDMIQQELFTARMSNLANVKTGHKMKLNNKRREMREVEGKIRAVTTWLRNYDSTVETEARKVDKLRHFIDTDMIRALHFLAEAVKNLHAYSNPGQS